MIFFVLLEFIDSFKTLRDILVTLIHLQPQYHSSQQPITPPSPVLHPCYSEKYIAIYD